MAQYQHLPIYKVTYDLLAKAARAQGLRVNAALTKAIPTTPTAASTLPHLVMA